jgi:hypothetical protein
MGKIKAPLLGVSARGKLGNSLVFSKWNSVNVIKTKVDPGYRNTADQQYQRAYYHSCVTKYREAFYNERDKEMWRLYLKDKGIKGSVYNAIVKYCLDYEPEPHPWGNPREMFICKLMGTQVFIRLKWDNNYAPKIKKFDRYRKLVASVYLNPDGEYWSRTMSWCVPGETYFFMVYYVGADHSWFYRWVHPTD